MIITETRNNFQGQDGENLISLSYSDSIILSGKKSIRIKNISQKFIRINSFFFDFLKGYNLPVGYLSQQDFKSLLFQNHTIFPFYIKVQNSIDKRSSKIFSKPEGELLSIPFYEIHYGPEKDNLVNESHLVSLEVCLVEDLKMMFRIASKVNVVLKSFFERRNSVLSEVRCYFGKQEDRIFLVNDFTPKSIKVNATGDNAKLINPYRLTSGESIKTYTDFLLNFTTN